MKTISLASVGIFCLAVSAAAEPLALSEELRQRCIEILRQGLRSDEFWPAMHAAEALTLAGHGAEVIAALKPRVAGELDDQRRCGLSRELVRAGDRSQVAVMLDILAKPDPYGHTHAAESLYKVGEIGDGRLLRQLMKSPDVKRQLMAAAALARKGDPDAFALIRKWLASENAEARKIAAWILALIGDQSDIPQLRRAAAVEEGPLAASYIANALACLGDAAGRARLGRNLDSPDWAVRVYAAEFAGHSRSAQFRDKLVKLLDDPVPDARIRAAQSLIVLASPPAR